MTLIPRALALSGSPGPVPAPQGRGFAVTIKPWRQAVAAGCLDKPQAALA